MFGLPEIIYLNRIAAEQGDRAVLRLIRRQRIEGRQAGVVRIEEGKHKEAAAGSGSDSNSIPGSALVSTSSKRER